MPARGGWWQRDAGRARGAVATAGGSLLPHSVEDFGTEVSRKRRGNKTEGRMGQGMGRGEGERQ